MQIILVLELVTNLACLGSEERMTHPYSEKRLSSNTWPSTGPSLVLALWLYFNVRLALLHFLRLLWSHSLT